MHFIFTARSYHFTRFPSATTVIIDNMVAVYVESLHTIFAVVYRPPDSPDSDFSNCMDKLQEMINDHSKDDRHSDVYVIGDFNMPVFNWEESYSDQSPSRAPRAACVSTWLGEGRECSFHEPTQWSVSKAHDIP